MAENRRILLLFIPLLVCKFSIAQKEISYGSNSNNGRFISVFNSKIYYEEYGAGTPLILLHGGMGSIADFKLCIPELSKHFRVIAPDAPGLANSEMTDTISYEILADYVTAMIDALHLDSVYVIGWSDGGNAALIAASKRPDRIRKALVSGANYKMSGYNFGDSNALKPIPGDFTVTADMQKWIDETFGVNRSHWKKIMNDRTRMWSQAIYFSPGLLAQIKIPVMLVMGDHDAVSFEHALDMHQLIKGSQFCVLPNSSHAVFTEKSRVIDEIAIEFFLNQTF